MFLITNKQHKGWSEETSEGEDKYGERVKCSHSKLTFQVYIKSIITEVFTTHVKTSKRGLKFVKAQ